MFDFRFFRDEKLISSFDNLKYSNDLFITDEITYNHNERKLTKETDDYLFILDFKNNDLFVRLIEDNKEFGMSIAYSNILEKNDEIKIIYKIDNNEPLNKIIIFRRQNER